MRPVLRTVAAMLVRWPALRAEIREAERQRLKRYYREFGLHEFADML